MSDLVGLLEDLAAEAWPAPIQRDLCGWRLRFADGVTRRANSALPRAFEEGPSLEERIELAERQYRAWGLPCRFQISPATRPRELPAELDRRGYRPEVTVGVHVARLADVLAYADGSRPVRIDEELDREWVTAAWSLGRDGAGIEAAEAIMRRCAAPTAYASLNEARERIAVGRGVCHGDWVGVFSMATIAAARRRGAARAVLGALAGWGEARGATWAYLQVEEDNHPARGLYYRAGFTPLYHYAHWRGGR